MLKLLCPLLYQKRFRVGRLRQSIEKVQDGNIWTPSRSWTTRAVKDLVSYGVFSDQRTDVPIEGTRFHSHDPLYSVNNGVNGGADFLYHTALFALAFEDKTGISLYDILGKFPSKQRKGTTHEGWMGALYEISSRSGYTSIEDLTVVKEHRETSLSNRVNHFVAKRLLARNSRASTEVMMTAQGKKIIDEFLLPLIEAARSANSDPLLEKGLRYFEPEGGEFSMPKYMDAVRKSLELYQQSRGD